MTKANYDEKKKLLVMRMIKSGTNAEDIAEALDIGVNTVKKAGWALNYISAGNTVTKKQLRNDRSLLEAACKFLDVEMPIEQERPEAEQMVLDFNGDDVMQRLHRIENLLQTLVDSLM